MQKWPIWSVVGTAVGSCQITLHAPTYKEAISRCLLKVLGATSQEAGWHAQPLESRLSWLVLLEACLSCFHMGLPYEDVLVFAQPSIGVILDYEFDA